MTTRALVIALIATVLCAVWIQQSEIRFMITQITESVPPVPALLVIIVLALVRKHCKLTKAEIITVYLFLVVTSIVAGPGVFRFVIAMVPAASYNNIHAAAAEYVPQWLTVSGESARCFYEGGNVPWLEWLAPFAGWFVLYAALFVVMLCLMSILRKRWNEQERLTYPQLYLPVEITQGSLLSNKVMWAGFGIAAAYNIFGILTQHGGTASFFSMDEYLTERPWSALRPLPFKFRPEIVGFGYLVSSEVSLSIVAAYWWMKAQALFATSSGLIIGGVPFAQQQGIGAYLVMALLIWRGAKGSQVGAVGTWLKYGVLVTFIWAFAAGIMPWWWAPYLVTFIAIAVVHAKIRAEVGAPCVWLFPYNHMHRPFFILHRLTRLGSWRALTALTYVTPLSRTYFNAIAGTQAEAIRLGEKTGVPRRDIMKTLCIAFVVGAVVAWVIHLTAYYSVGTHQLTAQARGAMNHAGSRIGILGAVVDGRAPVFNILELVAVIVGGCTVAGLTALRSVFLRLPLHPLAFCIVGSFGGTVWWSFAVVLVLKALIVKFGGYRRYKELLPGFVGFAIGHLVTAGAVNSLVGMFGGRAWQGYQVFFG